MSDSSKMTSLSRVALITAVGAVAIYAWQTADKFGRPHYDSFGQKIDYNHSIAHIPDSTDPKIINEARGSWLVEERIRKEKLGIDYIEIPFELKNYYGSKYF